MRWPIVAILACLPATAATYTVNASGGGDYTTIQGCASVAVAGDICSVHPGTYNEVVTPANSGSSGSPITFQPATATRPVVRRWALSNKSYITVRGFEVTHSGMTNDGSVSFVVDNTNRVRIEDNYIHDTVHVAVRANATATKAQYLYVGGNALVNIGPPNSGSPNYTGGRTTGIAVYGDYTLIESNNVSGVGDYLQTFGNHVVMRNNTLHDSVVEDSSGYNGSPGSGSHIDGWQSTCSGVVPETANYVLLEGNYHYNGTDANQHFGIITNLNACDTTNVVVRYNTMYNIGSGLYGVGSGTGIIEHHKVYNNTVSENVANSGDATINLSTVSSGSVLNNILSNPGTNPTSYRGYYLLTGIGNYNLGYFTAAATWISPIASEANGIRDSNPLFVGTADFKLQAGSPAKDAGGPLTTVATADSGTGTSLVLSDAHFFQDGWAGVTPDCIAVGTVGNVACISSINYETNTITLSSAVSRLDGDSVWLYSDSTLTQRLIGSGPDIGAFEYVPQPLRKPGGGRRGPGKW